VGQEDFDQGAGAGSTATDEDASCARGSPPRRIGMDGSITDFGDVLAASGTDDEMKGPVPGSPEAELRRPACEGYAAALSLLRCLPCGPGEGVAHDDRLRQES